MTWGKGRGEPVGGTPTSWREGLHAVIADVWNICKEQEKAPKSYTGCHTPPPLASSPKVLCSGLDSTPQMSRLILYPTLTAGSCKLLSVYSSIFSPEIQYWCQDLSPPWVFLRSEAVVVLVFFFFFKYNFTF